MICDLVYQAMEMVESSMRDKRLKMVELYGQKAVMSAITCFREITVCWWQHEALAIDN